MPKNWWYLWTLVLKKTPESPLDSKEIKPVNLKGDQPWLFTGRADAKAEVPVSWSSDVNRQLIGKVADAGKDWEQEKRASEDEMVGWHHQCNEHKLGQIQGDDEGQRGLACCSLWSCKESDTIGQLNNNKGLKKACLSSSLACPTRCDPTDCSLPGYQAPLPIGFPKQEYWSGSPFLSAGDLPNSGIKKTQVSCIGRRRVQEES